MTKTAGHSDGCSQHTEVEGSTSLGSLSTELSLLASSGSVRDPVSNWGRQPLMVVLWRWSACAPSHMYTHRRTNMHTQSRVEFCGPTDVQYAHTIPCWIRYLNISFINITDLKWKGRGHIETALLTVFIRLFCCAMNRLEREKIMMIGVKVLKSPAEESCSQG